MVDSPVDGATFRAALGSFATGVSVVTARDGASRDRGMTVSALCSLSLDPPLVLVCIGHDATLAPTLADAMHFGLSILSAEQEQLSRRFAGTATDRFDGIAHVRGAGGVALIEGAVAHIACRIAGRFPGGDHTILVGEVVEAAAFDGTPLLYHRGVYARLAE